MIVFLQRLRILRVERRAVTALEYGIMASALAGVLLAAFTRLSAPISQIMFGIGSSL